MAPLPWYGNKPLLPKLPRTNQYTARVDDTMDKEIRELQERWGMPINDVLNVILIYGLDHLRKPGGGEG